METPKMNLRRSTRTQNCTPKRQNIEERNLEAKSTQRDDEKVVSDSDTTDGEDETCEISIEDTVSTNSNLAGKEIYGFTKVKKHEKIILHTPNIEFKTSMDRVNTKIPKTPLKVRQRTKRHITKSLKDDEDSGSEYVATDSSTSISEPSNSDENVSADESNDEKPSNKRKTMKIQQPNKQSTENVKQKYVIQTEEYFTQSDKKILTSNHTLDKLTTPRLSQDQLQQLLSQMRISAAHRKSISGFISNSKQHFAKLLCLLHDNFNILLYGLGSKKNLMNDFHKEMCTDSPVIVVNGFFPSLTLKEILDPIANDLLQLNANTANAFETVALIEREMPNCATHFYLIVHNIEGGTLRNHKCQTVLSRLAAISNVHLMASIDHINAPLIWDHRKLSKFNFVWIDATTFAPYKDEMSFEGSMMINKAGTLVLSSLRNVFLSLTSNSKGIYTIIIKYQVENNTNPYYQGLLFKDLYTACREAFLVSSDLALRAQLTEFVDHKMVKLRRSADGAENLMIPLANNLLQQFLNEQENK